MRDDAFDEAAKVAEACATNHEVAAVGPQFVKSATSVAGQAISSGPGCVPLVGGFVVAQHTVFGGEQGLAVVLNNSTDGEVKGGPRIHQASVAVVEVEFEFTPSDPHVAVGRFIGSYAVDGAGR